MEGSREAGFREVNDTIRGLAAAGPSEAIWEFFCECDDLACRRLIRLALHEFDERRGAIPLEPILAAEHGAEGSGYEVKESRAGARPRG